MAKADAKPASSKGKAPAEPKKAPPPEEVEAELDADRRSDDDLDDEEDEDETDLEEEDEEEDEEDEEEDEEVAPAKPAKKPPVVQSPAPLAKAPSSPEHDGTWWVPHAVLAAIVLIGVFGFFGAFNSLVGPLYRKTLPTPSASAPAAAAAPSAVSPPAATPPPARTLVRPGAAASANAADPTFGAKRIVVRYKGAKNSKLERSKDDAKKRAEEALKKISGGAKFEDVAGEFSDEESAKTTGGNLGNFKRGTYDPAIIQTVEKLEVGKTSSVFESAEGFEIITRTK